MTTREEGGRRLVTLTSEGRAQLEERSAGLGDPFADFADAPDRPDLRDLLHRLHAAVRQIEVGGDAIQLEAAANGARADAAVAVFDLGRGGRGPWRVSEDCALVGACARFTAS